jgi:hypothetical protein
MTQQGVAGGTDQGSPDAIDDNKCRVAQLRVIGRKRRILVIIGYFEDGKTWVSGHHRVTSHSIVDAHAIEATTASLGHVTFLGASDWT